MRLSSDRILTTHVGSLPRSAAALELIRKKENGEDYDEAAFDETMTSAVDAVVARQVECGLDVVSDGETSKVGYSTYVKDRLSGFEGHSTRPPHLDLAPHPGFREAMTRMVGQQTFRRATCVGPVELVDREAMRKDLARLRAAAERHGVTEAFVNAASPGVVSSFQTNRYYPTHEAYVDAIAEAMRGEYDAVHAAGFLLQLDCPDLAMARHTGFQELSEKEFLRRAEHQVEALNRAVADIPADSMRMHVCWGNYEGPHDHDVPLERILGIVLKAKPAAILFEAANPRHRHEWTAWRDTRLPEDKVLIPGCLMSTTNYVEHPELVAEQICRYADIVGRERVIAGADCGFGTFAGLGRVDPDIAYKKLASLVEGAAIASRRLWRTRSSPAQEPTMNQTTPPESQEPPMNQTTSEPPEPQGPPKSETPPPEPDASERRGERPRIGEHVKSPQTWLRLLFMLIMVVLYGVAEFVTTVVVVIQFLFALFTGESNQGLLRLGQSLAAYNYQIIRYLTFNSEERPFPFDLDWPDPEERP